MARVWDRFLTENDRLVIAGGNLRAPKGPGRKSALLLIDMQITAIGDDMPIHEQRDRYPGACGPQAHAAIPVQQRLLAAARATGMPVIYSKHVFHPYTGMAKAASGVFAAADPGSAPWGGVRGRARSPWRSAARGRAGGHRASS